MKWLTVVGCTALVSAMALISWANHVAEAAGEGRLYDRVADVPKTPVGLVFGCARLFQGRPNLYFKARIEAAVGLWEAGKVQCFIVSGDNHAHGYNEPEDMKAAMVEAGVPEEKIVCDYAGLRTLDSVVRAKEVFGAEKVVLISQEFHNERAAYLADAIDLEFVGLNAEAVTGPAAMKTDQREKLARAKMWLDVNLLRTKPKHLGDQEELPLGE
ncbi:ElyC/SanA/YdcF family protein [Verrucomicrobiaceae bacterium 227]